jgi:hypothetical protein
VAVSHALYLPYLVDFFKRHVDTRALNSYIEIMARRKTAARAPILRSSPGTAGA